MRGAGKQIRAIRSWIGAGAVCLCVVGAPGPSLAVGGNDAAPATKVDRDTQKCQDAIGKAGERYAVQRARILRGCLTAILKCDEQSSAAAAETCRRKLLRPGVGLCAEGKVDDGVSLLGIGGAASADATPSSKARLVREMNRYLKSVDKTCVPGADLDDPDTGLGFPPATATKIDVVDATNLDPGGIGCLANAIVLETHPLADAIVQQVEAFHEECIDGPTPGASCTSNAQCGTGTCGKLALALREGMSIKECTSTPPLPAVCGDGAAEVPEQCDDGNLVDGDGCSSACTLEPASQVVATGQVTCYDVAGLPIPCAGTGHDGDILAGATLAYQDNGDGTITDLRTGLMWEKLSDDGTVNDKDAIYTWTQAFTVKIAGLNAGGGFAGYTDWRLPNYKELVSILDLEMGSPTIDPIFNGACPGGCTVLTCSCIGPDGYWTSTSATDFPDRAWVIRFDGGSVNSDFKGSFISVRGVRGP